VRHRAAEKARISRLFSFAIDRDWIDANPAPDAA
jgi:hypothetical protein